MGCDILHLQDELLLRWSEQLLSSFNDYCRRKLHVHFGVDQGEESADAQVYVPLINRRFLIALHPYAVVGRAFREE